MVCTNAFGMGIDKPDVRLVVHVDVPECVEKLLPGSRKGWTRRQEIVCRLTIPLS